MPPGPEVLARLTDFAHMWSMSGRPCNPGSDFRGLWQVFLRDMPMPQCPAPAEPGPDTDVQAADVEAVAAKPPANSSRNR